MIRTPLRLFALEIVLTVAVAGSAWAQRPQPDQDLNCWGCEFFAGGPPGNGWRCMPGHAGGGDGCRQWLNGEGSWECELVGSCPDPLAAPDSLDAVLAAVGASAQLVHRAGPTTYTAGTCTDRRTFVLDGDGQVLGYVLRHENNAGIDASKPSGGK